MGPANEPEHETQSEKRKGRDFFSPALLCFSSVKFQKNKNSGMQEMVCGCISCCWKKLEVSVLSEVASSIYNLHWNTENCILNIQHLPVR